MDACSQATRSSPPLPRGPPVTATRHSERAVEGRGRAAEGRGRPRKAVEGAQLPSAAADSSSSSSSIKDSIGGQEHTRLRSPYVSLRREVVGQNLSRLSEGS